MSFRLGPRRPRTAPRTRGTKEKGDLEKDVATARDSAQARSKRLGESVDASKDEISASWSDVQRSWNEHVAKIREDIEAKKAEPMCTEPSGVPKGEWTTRRSRFSSPTARSKKPSTTCSRLKLALDEAAELSAG
ncbi:MAG TPA: hypothetical protein VIZ61_12210 [Solirubrobacterales bacterium]